MVEGPGNVLLKWHQDRIIPARVIEENVNIRIFSDFSQSHSSIWTERLNAIEEWWIIPFHSHMGWVSGTYQYGSCLTPNNPASTGIVKLKVRPVLGVIILFLYNGKELFLRYHTRVCILHRWYNTYENGLDMFPPAGTGVDQFFVHKKRLLND